MAKKIVPQEPDLFEGEEQPRCDVAASRHVLADGTECPDPRHKGEQKADGV